MTNYEDFNNMEEFIASLKKIKDFEELKELLKTSDVKTGVISGNWIYILHGHDYDIYICYDGMLEEVHNSPEVIAVNDNMQTAVTLIEKD